MIAIAVAIAMLAIIGHARAQTPQVSWAKQLTDSGNDLFPLILTALDYQGNIVLAAPFTAPKISFGDQTLTNLSFVASNYYGPADSFVAKYTSSGDLLWVQHIGRAGVGGCAADSSGNVVAAGYLNRSNVWIGNTFITNADSAITFFVAKFDLQGNVLWVRQIFGGEGSIFVAVDGNANIHVGGEFGTPSLIVGTNILVNAGGYGSDFAAEYSSAGDVLWARVVNFSEPKEEVAFTADYHGNSYLGDSFSGVASFGSMSLTNSGVMLVKYDPTGNLVWAKGVGQNSGSIIRSLAVGSQGDCALFIDNGGAPVVVKYDSSANPVWTDAINAIGIGYPSSALGNLTVDQMDNCWVFSVSAAASLGIGDETVDGGRFVAKYDPAGDVLWAKSVGSPGSSTFINGLAGTVDSTGSVSLFGEVSGTNQLNLDGIALSGPSGSTDFYFAARISGPAVNVQLLDTLAVVSWPTNAAGLRLETRPSLSGGSWSPVTNAPLAIGDQYTITNNISSGSQFYRLRNF